MKFNHPVFNDAEITLIVKDVAAIARDYGGYRLNREKPNIQDEVYTTFVVGGGALALSEYLPKFLKDYQLEFTEDPIYAKSLQE